MPDRDNGNGNGKTALRYWPVVAFLITLIIAGFGAWGSVKSEMAVVGTKLEAHETSQRVADQERERRLQRIEDKIDRILAREK